MSDHSLPQFSELTLLKQRVTELEAREQCLQADYHRLKQLHDRIPLSYHSLDEDGCIVEINQTWLDTLGYVREEVIGQPFNKFLHPACQDHFKDNFSRFKTIGEILGVAFEMVRKDGSTLQVSLDGKIGTGDGGCFQQTHCVFQKITEQKKLEKTLLLTQFSVDSTHDAIVWIRPDARYVYANDAVCRMLGYSRDEMLSKTVQEINPGLSWEQWQRNWEELRQFGSLSYTANFQAKDGRRVPVEVTINYLLYDGQEIGCGIARDITNRTQAEESLRESEKKYRLVFDSAQDPIFMCDDQARILEVNPIACERLGYTYAELVGMTVEQVDTPEQAQYVPERFKRLLDHGNAIFESEHQRKDGTAFPVEVNAWRIDWQGRPAVMSLCRDITERNRMNTYREMGREILQLLNTSGDFEDVIQRVLAVLQQRTGSDAVGLRLQDGEDFPYLAQRGFSTDFLLTENTLIKREADGGVCRDPDGKVRLECTCGLVISGKTDPTNPLFTPGGSCWTNDSKLILEIPLVEDPRLHPRNQCIHHGYASVALVPVRDDQKIVGMIQLNDRRQGRFTLDTIELLEGIASHIGAALMRKKGEGERKSLQAQLQQAQKMEAIGTLAGGIAHDFNNILGAILGYAELARNASPPGSMAVKWLDKELAAVDRATMLVKQILAFSRQAETKRAPLQLATVIKEATKLLRRTIPSTITIRLQVDSAVKSILADSTQVHQIIMNLCTNAFHAMEQTGGTLELALKDTELSQGGLLGPTEVQPGSFVVLSVRDSGAGIPPEIKKRIFDPYFSTKDVGKGTGMGLAIVHGIVKSYGGFITVESEPGEGTVFQVFFPAIESEAGHETLPGEICPSGIERILLIDDEEVLAEMGTAMLESLGYEVTARTSSLGALETFRQQAARFDLVITDQTMPGMTGMDLIREMRLIRPHIPTILCTGYSTLVSEEQAKAAGVSGFAMKPLTRKGIATLIRNVLDQVKTSN